MVPQVGQVVGVDVVKEAGTDELRHCVAEHEDSVVVYVDNVSLLAHPHVKRKVEVADSHGEIEEGEVCGEFSEEKDAGLLAAGHVPCHVELL